MKACIPRSPQFILDAELFCHTKTTSNSDESKGYICSTFRWNVTSCRLICPVEKEQCRFSSMAAGAAKDNGEQPVLAHHELWPVRANTGMGNTILPSLVHPSGQVPKRSGTFPGWSPCFPFLSFKRRQVNRIISSYLWSPIFLCPNDLDITQQSKSTGYFFLYWEFR